jgi:F-type H+/Na+-transporting ATPase subunit alpha
MNDYQQLLKQSGEYGETTQVNYPIVEANGLPGARIKEVVVFETGEIGQIYDLSENSAKIILFSPTAVKAGSKVARAGTTLQVPVIDNILGKILNPFGSPIVAPIDKGQVIKYLPIDVAPLTIDKRAKIKNPLITGTAVVDIVAPLGRGQRELVLGDRKTGKSTFVLSVINHQIDEGAVVIYAAIGNKKSDIKYLEETMKENEKLKKNMIVVASSAFDSPGLIYLTPFTAMALAEYYRDQGRDTLVVMDDLLTHAKFYREFSLLAETFPGRDSYPGDIFHIHARLLERAGCFKYEGSDSSKSDVSITCLPIAETQEADLTGYIVSNLMSITDGHLFFDNNVYAKGIRPAINTSLSVTRVGKQTQDKIMKDINREVAGLFSVYERVENLSHFGSELSESVKNTIKLGKKVQNFFNQPEGKTFPKEVYLTLFCLVWLGILNTEEEIENARQKLSDAARDQANFTFMANLLKTDSFNGLLRLVGNKKEDIMRMIN